MVNGIINVYKEKGFTSFDVVAKMRGIFHQKKIGHTGTLDPDAEGVLPVCLGKATKVCDLLTDKDKEYEAVLFLGQETDTQDITGAVQKSAEVNVTEEEIAEIIHGFVGTYDQIPPMYSALKVNGQKLCDLARKGITVERQARAVTIYEIEILDIKLPEVRMRVHCSKGTYIRTLCQDIGEKAGCYGCMKELLRTRVAGFLLDDAYRIGEIEQLVKEKRQSKDINDWNLQLFSEFMYPIDTVFEHYPKLKVTEEAEKLVRNGNRIPASMIETKEQTKEQIEEQIQEAETIRLYDWNDIFIGLYSYQKLENEYKPVKLFMD